MSNRSGWAAVCAAALVSIAACSEGGGDGGPSTPGAPSGVTATPGNTLVNLSWPAVAGAVSYNVYTSPTLPVTTASTKTTVGSPAATLPALTNGTPVYAAVTALGGSVSGNVESALSNQVCAVPTASDTTGLTMYDAFCGGTLDGTKWATSLLDYGVASSAMVLGSQISSMESRTVQGLNYQTLASVIPPVLGQRVSTLTANITVPASTATRTGSADIRALVRLLYQPPAARLNFPGGVQDQLVIEVGLRDSGSGLQAFRNVRHCDSANCTTRSTTGIAIADPAGFTATANGVEATAAAAYDTKYTVSAALDEATGVLTWSIAGGTFGAGVTGTADPTTYLGTAPGWSGILLAGNGFLSGQVGNRVFDDAVSAGSSGSISAKFENVQAGFNNAAATVFDDFSGAGGNSGPADLSPVKWAISGAAGNASADLTGGKLVAHIQGTSPNDNGVSTTQALSLNNPNAVNTVQADFTVTACNNSSTGPRANQVRIQGNFYNDGTLGTTAPNDNRPNSNTGDVRASLSLDCRTDAADFIIIRFNSQTTSTILGSGVFPTGVVTGNTHKLKVKWDPAAHTFTFQVDSIAPVVVDPTQVGGSITVAAPVAGPANSPLKQLVWFASIFSSAAPSQTGTTASMDLTINNVFTAP